MNITFRQKYTMEYTMNLNTWMFHCYDLHHASASMVTELKYTDYKTDFVPDPNASNKPE
ncbi:hypothetical protein [Paenibacillus larvae]|uniref:hypothetical protein n=1 Tax=Paenibacillus larvae TaxID=1464 RepID=UPI0039FC8455